MTPERWRQVTEVFHAVLARAESARAGYLDQVCAGDPALRAEVDAMLAIPSESASLDAISLKESSTSQFEPGTMIGPYRIECLIGAGGMGEVYRARDTKLGRDVAIKILPHAFTADRERLARFEREARMLAALNHPHIGAIYGIEDLDGMPALVLELVDGETLAERLQRRPLPIAEALTIARQITDALDAAHEKGIVHRDLKPANIKITPDGVVKVLDFGLAKLDARGADGGESQSPTVTIGGTHEGLIVGTAAYMSPEQSRGLSVDKRTDIWAFGCVLYEMLTGRSMFGGKTISDTIAAILEREPDWSALPPPTPHNARRLLRRCLEKDPKERLRDIGDARVEIREAAAPRERRSEDTAGIEGRSRRIPSRWRIALGVGIVILGSGVVWLTRPGEPMPRTGAVRLELSPPAGTEFEPGSGTISPDGRLLAFMTRSPRGTNLWVRPVDAQTSRELPGTDNAFLPFWSPDSRTLGFFAGGKLLRIDIDGGTPTVLADAPGGGRGGTWNADGVIVFNAVNDGPLLEVPAAGGKTTPLTALDRTRQENSHRYPMFLPDGRRFLYFIRSGDSQVRGLYLGSLDRPHEKVRLVASDSGGIYAPDPDGPFGHLIWLRNGALVAQRIDAERGLVVGEPTTIAASIRAIVADAFSPVSVSREGTLVYGSSPNLQSQLTWYARDGKPLSIVGNPDTYSDVRISPDGQRIAVNRSEGSTGFASLWLIELGHGIPSRVTSHQTGINPNVLAWSPDAQRIAYLWPSAPPNLGAATILGGTPDERLTESRSTQESPDWSPDGHLLLYADTPNDPSSKTRTDLQLLSLDGTHKSAPYLQTPFVETRGRFSPDGRWIAYTSDESGQNEVHVQSFPAGGGKWRISTKGGDFVRWRRDGKELLYSAPDGTLMTVSVRSVSRSLDFGEPMPLFKVPGPRGTYDVTADGTAILAIARIGNEAAWSMTLVVNWPALLKK
jgi:serine/threonine protein kinase/Tol biopolymer transport system component